MLERHRLFGLDFVDATSDEVVVDALMDDRRAWLEPMMLPLLATPNVDILVHLDRRTDPVAVDLIRRAGLVVPDGQPVIWASRLLGRPLRARLAGSSIVGALWPRLVEAGRPMMVIASSERLSAAVLASDPTCVCLVAPNLGESNTVQQFASSCVEAAVSPRPGGVPTYVFVCVGFLAQYRVIAELLDRWPSDVELPTFLAVGGSLDMYFGFKRRAPRWVQRVGLEWLFRFAQEPRRLFRRYFIDDAAFAKLVWKERQWIRAEDGAVS